MKNIKYTLFVVVAAIATFFVASCTDKNDWNTDSSESRYFTPYSVNGAQANQAEYPSDYKSRILITWTTYDPASQYLIEICTKKYWREEDPKTGRMRNRQEWLDTDPIGEEGAGSQVFYASGKSFTTPILAVGEYRIRIKALGSDGKAESKFKYYEKDGNYFYEVGGVDPDAE